MNHTGGALCRSQGGVMKLQRVLSVKEVLCPSEETPAQNTKTVATHDRPATTAQVTVCDYLFVHQDESPETPAKSEQSLMLKL